MATAGRVLVVDDEPDVLSMLGDFLKEEGFEVVEAANGLEALLQVKRARPEAVLLDLMMPRLGGLEAIKRIRAFDPSIRIIVITGVIDEELHGQARALGAVAVFTKPLPTAAVADALRGQLPPEPAPAPVTAAPLRPDAAPASILIVVDEPKLRAGLETLLAAKGHEVRATRDAAAGVRAVVERVPDIVLLDIEMPGLSGVGVLPTIVALAPDAKVIMVSESVNAELAKRSLAFGAFDCVAKPIDPAYLLQSVETALALRRIDPGA